MDPGADKMRVQSKCYAIQPCHRPCRWKAWPGAVDVKGGTQHLGTAAGGPFVEVAKNQGRHRGAVRQGRPDRVKLHAPVAAYQAKMEADDTKRNLAAAEVCLQSPAWFETGKFYPVQGVKVQILARKDGLAMPAKAEGGQRKGQRFQPGGALQKITGQCGRSGSKAVVDLLQHHNVGVQRGQNRQNTVGATTPVEPEALVNVIAGDAQMHVKHIGRVRRRLKCQSAHPRLFLCLAKGSKPNLISPIRFG